MELDRCGVRAEDFVGKLTSREEQVQVVVSMSIPEFRGAGGTDGSSEGSC